MKIPSILVVTVLTAFSSATAQTTIVVSGGGAALQAAINAAAPGDTLDVQPGTYSAVTCSKGLRIGLQPGALVDGAGAIGLTLTNLPANERFQLDGGEVGSGIAATQCAGLVVVLGTRFTGFVVQTFSSCTGPIVFDTIDCIGGPTPVVAMGPMQFLDCPDVTFRNSRLPQLTFTGSRAVLQGSTVHPYGFSAPGVTLRSGGLTIAGGFVTGSAAVFFSIPRAAIRIDQGDLRLTGGATIQALQYPLNPAPCIEANGGTIHCDPSIVLIGTPVFGGPGLVLTEPMPSLAVAHAATTMNVSVASQPGDAVITFGGMPTTPYATPWGDAWLLPTDPILDIAILPASGTSTWTRTFASVPPFFVLVLQSVALTPSGGIVLGAPLRFAWN